MKAQIATLIDRGSHMSGLLGDAVVILERAGTTRNGDQRWRLLLATPEESSPVKTRAAHNRNHARERVAQRKAEGITEMGGGY